MKPVDKAFDPTLTYWQALRIVARGLIRWPMSRDDVDELWFGIKAVGLCLFGAILRILALILLPLSAPLFTWVVQIERRRIEEAKVRMRKGIHRNGLGRTGE